MSVEHFDFQDFLPRALPHQENVRYAINTVGEKVGVFKDPHTAAQLFRKNQCVFALVFRMTSHFPKGQLVKNPHTKS